MWTQLFLKKGQTYVATLLERAKGSALDVVINNNAPIGTTTLLSSHVRQIRYLEFPGNSQEDIISFSEISSGPLPLLRNLKIAPILFFDPPDQHNAATPSSSRLFGGATNLEVFFFNSNQLELLSRFVFPNLTTFQLSTWECDASGLFDFLKASPTLRMVEVDVHWMIVLENIPQATVITLPNVETLSLHMTDGLQVYDITGYISCPRARRIFLGYDISDDCIVPGLELFPSSVSWRTTLHQFAQSPV